MKKTKTKSRRKIKTRPAPTNFEQRVPYQGPALRSEAFARALTDAKSCVNDPESLDALFNQAARKAAAIPRDPFKENWPSDGALLWIIAALNYLIDPFDLIPDKTPFLGFLDDAAVIAFAVGKTRQALDDFMTWETAGL